MCVPVRVLIIKNKHVSRPVAEANKVLNANVSPLVFTLYQPVLKDYFGFSFRQYSRHSCLIRTKVKPALHLTLIQNHHTLVLQLAKLKIRIFLFHEVVNAFHVNK